MEIVLLLGFADAIFRRERSDDRKCVCASQASQKVAVFKRRFIYNSFFNLFRDFVCLLLNGGSRIDQLIHL